MTISTVQYGILHSNVYTNAWGIVLSEAGVLASVEVCALWGEASWVRIPVVTVFFLPEYFPLLDYIMQCHADDYAAVMSS